MKGVVVQRGGRFWERLCRALLRKIPGLCQIVVNYRHSLRLPHISAANDHLALKGGYRLTELNRNNHAANELTAWFLFAWRVVPLSLMFMIWGPFDFNALVHGVV